MAAGTMREEQAQPADLLLPERECTSRTAGFRDSAGFILAAFGTSRYAPPL